MSRGLSIILHNGLARMIAFESRIEQMQSYLVRRSALMSSVDRARHHHRHRSSTRRLSTRTHSMNSSGGNDANGTTSRAKAIAIALPKQTNEEPYLKAALRMQEVLASAR